MTTSHAASKYMTLGEGGLAAAMTALAFVSIVVAAKAYTPEYAFHAYLFAAASVASVFAIVNRYFERSDEPPPLEIDGKPNYNMGPVKLATLLSRVLGHCRHDGGLWIALELAYPALNFGLAYISFGRLRPLHTSAVIFAFGGNVLIATSFYVVQRTCRARLAGDLAPWFVVLGYNFFIVIAGTGYLLGITQSKEYAEPEWYADLWLTIVWVTYLLVFSAPSCGARSRTSMSPTGSISPSSSPSRSCTSPTTPAIPVSLFSSKSYIVWSGVQDAMVQWWYGHNAVGFFLTAGFLGIMYYFIPKRAERPVYCYRLSIIHFWALIFLYIWAGPHHLHYTALPDWTQTLGMTFSIMLWMPSWGGMINGLMTLSGAWDKLRTDPVLRMMVLSVAFYGMSTFEGPVMSIKEVNSLSHYTDWTIGHVHSGALGWVGFVSFGAIYCLVPWLWNRPLYSLRLVNWHFWIATIGIVVYVTSMWVSGILQGLMWRCLYQPRLPRIFLHRDRPGDASVLCDPRARRRAVPRRRADHGLQCVADHLSVARSAGAGREPGSGRVGGSQMSTTLWQKHWILETQLDPAAGRHPDRDRHRRSRRDRPAVLSEKHDRDGRRHAALYAARARRPQHLRQRRLLSVPFADDPGAARRGRALRPLFARRRERVRPPVPVGLQAQRSRSGARRRQIFRRLAPRPPEQSALGGAGIDHAGLSLAVHHRSRLFAHRRRHEGPGDLGVPYSDEMIANALADVRTQATDDAPDADALAKRYPKAQSRDFDGNPDRVTEADALIAYLQMLGTLVDFKLYDDKANIR